MDIICTFFQTFKNPVGVCCDRLQVSILIISFDKIFLSELQRIHPDLFCNIIHKALNCKTYLRDPVSTHRSAYRCIRIDSICLSFDIRTCILQPPGSQTISCYGVSMGGICSLIGNSQHILCQKMPLTVNTCRQIILNRMTGSGVAESFLSGYIEFDRSAANLRGKKRI